MTKEEILTKCLVEKYKVNYPEDSEADMIAYVKSVYADEAGGGIMLRGLEVAMDIYAKQQSVVFNKWFVMYKYDKLTKCKESKEEYTKWLLMTLEDYYDIFIQSQNSQK